MDSGNILEVSSFILFSAIAIMLTYAVGWIFYLPFGKLFQHNTSTFFFKLLLGFVFIPALYAIYFTSCYTILNIIPIIYLIIIFLSRKHWHFSFKIEWLNLIACLLILILFICIQLYRNGYFDPSVEWLSQADIGIYTNVAAYLTKTGIETSSPWYQLIDVSADGLAKPYHYGDLWQLALFLNLSFFSPIKTAVYTYTPFVCALATMGGYALWTSICKKQTLGFKVLGILLAVVAVMFNTGVPNVRWSVEFNNSLFMYFKIAPLNIFLLSAFLLWQQQQYKLGALFAALIPLFNIIYAPIVCSAFGLFFLIKVFTSDYKKREHLLRFTILVLMSIYIILFYKILGSLQTSSVNTEPRPGGYWYWLIKEAAAIGVKYCIFNVVLIFFGFLFIKNASKIHSAASIKDMLLVNVFLLLSSAAAIGVLNNNAEAFQFTRLLISPVNGITLLFLVAALLNIRLKPPYNIILVIGVTTLVIYSLLATLFFDKQREDVVSKVFLKKASILLYKTKNPIGGAIMNPFLEKSYTADPRTCYYCNFLKAFKHDTYWVNSLSVPENLSNLPFPERKQAIELSPFYRFMQRLKDEENYKSYENAQIQFINTYKVDFVVVETGATIPTDIAACSTEMRLDSLTGHRLLLLKRPCASSSY